MCPIVVVNAVGKVGIATARADEIAAFLADAGYASSADEADVTASNPQSFDVDVDNAVLLPRQPNCEIVTLEGFGPVVSAPWPAEYEETVLDTVPVEAMVVVIGEVPPEPDLVMVTNVVGLEPSRAIELLESLGFEVEALPEAPGPTEIVLATDPEPGTLAEVGSRVVLIVDDPPAAQPGLSAIPTSTPGAS